MKKRLGVVAICAFSAGLSLAAFAATRVVERVKMLQEDGHKLSVGETVTVEGVSLMFVSVPRDSRCPPDVQCIVAGEARVVMEATSGGETTELVFEVPPGGGDERELDGLTIALTKLEPETNSKKKIEESAYVATIVVEEKRP